jgi:hypothetical protein
MRRTVTIGAIVSFLLLMDACAVTRPAPGAAEIRLTKDAADVAKCQAVGNIAAPLESGRVDMASAKTQFQNQAVGFGANVGLVTEGLLFAPAVGIAYRCP